MTPEEKARVTIDELLIHAGWAVQDREAMNLYDPAHPGVAVREAHLATGYADYLLFVDGAGWKSSLLAVPGSRNTRMALYQRFAGSQIMINSRSGIDNV